MFKFGFESQWIQTNNVNARMQGGSFSFSGRYTGDLIEPALGFPAFGGEFTYTVHVVPGR